MKYRNASLDLLRIVLSLFVIVLHLNNTHGGALLVYADSGIMRELVLLGESFSICAVNTFIILSRYFLCDKKERSVSKVIILFVTTIGFSCLFTAIGSEITIRSIFHACIPINYYLWLYSTLYLISPWINRIMYGFDQYQFKKLIGVIVLLFVVWPTIVDLYEGIFGTHISAISTVSATDHGSGYTIVNFCVLYIIGAYIRQFASGDRKSRTVGAILYVLGGFGVFVLIHYAFTAAIEYCNLFVVLEASGLALFFSSISLPDSRLLTFLAAQSFNVFLIHERIFFICKWFGLERVNEIDAVVGIGVIVCTVICIYLLSILISTIARFLFAPIKKMIEKTMKGIKVSTI